MKISAILVVVLIGLPVSYASGAERSTSSAAIGGPISTKSFVTQLALGDMFETKSSELAAIRGNAAAREFAATMIQDHQKSSSELSIIVKPQIDKTPLPSQLDAAKQSKINRLKKLPQKEFSKAYFGEQVSAHASALDLLERYAATGDHVELKQLASTLLPKVKHHLEMAKQQLK